MFFDENKMDLKQQLVIWKRANYLQGHIALSPLLYDRLVEEGIFTAQMMTQVQVSRSQHIYL